MNDLPVFLDRNAVLVFQRQGIKVRVSEGAVDSTCGDEPSRREVGEVLSAQGWLGIWIPLSELGFELVAIEMVEEMALDFLEDAIFEASEASKHLQLADECKDDAEALTHRLTAAPHVRKAVILSAAAAEAYINEFIARELPSRNRDLDRLSPPTKWSVSVELATGRRLEDELPGLESLRTLFTFRNKLMHFHPTRRTIGAGESQKKSKSISALLAEEWEIWGFPRAVFDAIRALHGITDREPWDRVKEMVSYGIEQETLGYMMAWSERVGAVLDRLDPDDVERLREEFTKGDGLEWDDDWESDEPG